MGEILSRDTRELEIPELQDRRVVGVIGASSGAGAGFITDLLERELFRAGEGYSVIDLGENGSGSEELTDILVVMNSGEELDEGMCEMLRRITDTGKRCGLVLNRGCERDEISSVRSLIMERGLKIPVFRIPVLDTVCFTDLYNYVFYS